MLGLDKISWNMLGHFDLLAEGAEVAEPHLLFDKIEDAPVEAQVKRQLDTRTANEAGRMVSGTVKGGMLFRGFRESETSVWEEY